jgi:hypothetical protein
MRGAHAWLPSSLSGVLEARLSAALSVWRCALAHRLSRVALAAASHRIDKGVGLLQ